MPRQSREFYPQAARRLLLAVINQAINDVLENEGEAEAAEQWLSSGDFDSFVEPLGCGPEVFRHRLAHPLRCRKEKQLGGRNVLQVTA
jgi:hypothetical protein